MFPLYRYIHFFFFFLTPSVGRRRIRSKIESDGAPYIKTVYGMGFQWTGGEAKMKLQKPLGKAAFWLGSNGALSFSFSGITAPFFFPSKQTAVLADGGALRCCAPLWGFLY